MSRLPITNVYIVRHEGHCLLHCDYSDKQRIDQDDQSADFLITGIISAIFMTTKQIGKEQIRTMRMGEKIFLYETSEQVIYILGTQQTLPETVGREILSRIKTSFLEHYGAILRSDLIDLDIFADFRTQVDAILAEISHGLDKPPSSEEKIALIQEYLSDMLGSAGDKMIQEHFFQKGRSKSIETEEDLERLFSALLDDLSAIMDKDQAHQLIRELHSLVSEEN
ncbi:MAG: hypothetical protein ACXACI_07145 [Candidatus Hodarchaeales archaeon]